MCHTLLEYYLSTTNEPRVAEKKLIKDKPHWRIHKCASTILSVFKVTHNVPVIGIGGVSDIISCQLDRRFERFT